MKVRAAVFVAPGRPLEMKSLESGELRSGEALVRVEACTLCGSDLHSYHGRRGTPTPGILGHEILGFVEALRGEVLALDGTPLHTGDRITWSVVVACGRCFYCQRDTPQKCEKLRKYGHEPITADMPLTGGLAEYCRLAAGTAIVRVPRELSYRVACPAACATATVAAVIRRMGQCRGETIVVQGLGMLGLTACAMAREAGAAGIVGVDPDDRRRAAALQFGADEAVAPTDPSLNAIVRQRTQGRGADAVLELAGDRDVIVAGLSLLRIGGRYVLAGALIPGPAVPVDPREVITRLLSIYGVHNYAPADLLSAIDFLTTAGSRYPFASLVGQELPLASADAAFQIPPGERPPRVAIRP